MTENRFVCGTLHHLAGEAVTAPKEWLKDEPERVRAAAIALLNRMAGCAEPECLSCKGNREQVEAFIHEVRQEAFDRVCT